MVVVQSLPFFCHCKSVARDAKSTGKGAEHQLSTSEFVSWLVLGWRGSRYYHHHRHQYHHHDKKAFDGFTGCFDLGNHLSSA